jgi:hypothetical protein
MYSAREMIHKVKSGDDEIGRLTNTTYSSRYFTDEIPSTTSRRAQCPRALLIS